MERVDEYTAEDKAADEEALMKASPSRPIASGVPILNSAYPRAKGDEESKLIDNFAKSV
jgi:hypothetical protein